nr:hypothetical protein [Candidatus Saccharibacteria bacterium]
MTSAAQHPKKASVEAARNLHHSGVLPVSEELRAMSAHDPERHAPNTELIQAKAERFAILAHFIVLVAEQSVDGQGEAAQFRPGYIKQTIQEAADTDRYIAKDAKMMILTNVLLDVDETIAQD